MKFTSTRKDSKLYSFEEAILSGYAPDGGLFVPQILPKVDSEVLNQWSELDFLELSIEVLYPFLKDEIPRADLHMLLQQSLSGFDTELGDLVPIVPLVSKTTPDNPPCETKSSDIFIAELFHGPTYCFKDFGLRTTIQLLNYFAIKHQTKVTLVVSTTGDTGPAAVQAVQDCGSRHLGILVHYPEGQISDFQRKQLTTVESSQVKIVAFQGGGDDMDIPIKNIMTDPDRDDVLPNHFICGVNSYNIGRPLMQMVHFIWTYLRVAEKLKVRINSDEDFRLDIVIPTGAMGNMAGCYMAKAMGVPLGILCAGVNVNDITDVVFRTGQVQRTHQPMKKTLSDAINIQLPYNLERLLFYLTEQDHHQIRKWYSQLEGPELPFQIISNDRCWNKLQSEFRSTRITDDEVCEMMQSMLEEYNYWADPHTCVALAAAKKLGYFERNNNARAVAVMATAAPCKFEEAVTTALGTEKWQMYEQDMFPIRGKVLYTLKEVSPIVYTADCEKTLAENQSVWEAISRELIRQLL
jgi:threonine synthase